MVDTSAADRPMNALPVTVLSGLDRMTVDDLATTLLLRQDRLAVVHADPTTADRGHVTVHVHHHSGAGSSRSYLLVHECVTCTLRAAVVGELATLARAGEHDAVLVQLHPGLAADSMLRGLQADLPAATRLDTHVVVLAPDWLDILAGGSSLADHDAAIGADDRFAAAVLCAGIETASTLIVTRPPRPAIEHFADEDAALDLLAPAATRLRLRNVLEAPDADVLSTGRFDPDCLDPLVPYGIREEGRSLPTTRSLSLVRWSADRPLHPIRLHAALDQLADGVIRSSGRLDLADQPGFVVGWDSVGESLELGPIAPWRGDQGVRRSTLTLLGDGLDAGHICEVLDRCLLDDAELTIMTSAWHDITEICP